MNEPLTIQAIEGGKAHAVENYAAFPATRGIVVDEFGEYAPAGGCDSHPVNLGVRNPDADETYPTVPLVKRPSPQGIGVQENSAQARAFYPTPRGDEERGLAPGNSRNCFDCLSVGDNIFPVCPFLQHDIAHVQGRAVVFAKPAELSEAREARPA